MRTGRLVLYAVLFAALAAVSTLAMAEHGYLGLWRFVWAGSANLQIFTDLFVASCLCLTWMVGDARAKGLRIWPYVVLTVLTGSFGLLAYMLRREVARGRATTGARPAGGDDV